MQLQSLLTLCRLAALICETVLHKTQFLATRDPRVESLFLKKSDALFQFPASLVCRIVRLAPEINIDVWELGVEQNFNVILNPRRVINQ